MGNLLRRENKEELVGMLRQMHHIRFFEEKVMQLLTEGYIKGGSHLYAGEEAVAVGACSAIEKEDLITSTHRGHGHAVAKGGDLKELMAEICGKETGCCKGKGGSLHLADLDTGNLGANGIVGGSLAIAAGAALSCKLRESGQVVLCFFGDGAVNQGLFYESMNMSDSWDLPVVYVCENNMYGMSVSVERATAIEDLAQRAEAFSMPSMIVDGMDVLDVRQGVSEAAERARNGGGPTFVECKTYRYFGHSRSDPRKYRTDEEEKEWKERDPIPNFAQQLITNEIITPEEAEGIEEEANEDIEEATRFAKESPDPEPSELYTDLFAE